MIATIGAMTTICRLTLHTAKDRLIETTFYIRKFNNLDLSLHICRAGFGSL